MAVNLDALSITNILSGIQLCSKKRLLSCLSSMDKLDLKCLIISALKQSQPPCSQITQIIDTIWNDYSDNTVGYTTHIKQYFNKKQNNKKTKTNKQNTNNLFTSLPSSIGAYIISFNTMNDRMNCELISKDLYKF
eukprot:512513_1